MSSLPCEVTGESPAAALRQQSTLLNCVTRAFGSEAVLGQRVLLGFVVACASTAGWSIPSVPVMALICTSWTMVGVAMYVTLHPSVYAGPCDWQSSLSSLLHIISARAGWIADIVATAIQLTLLVLQDLVVTLFCVVVVNIALRVWTLLEQ